MPNDPPYGGRIEVRKNGSVIWQISAREYPKDRDTDGTLEYAIRMVDASRNMFTSRDGKCLVYIQETASPCTAESSDDASTEDVPWKYLVVSGYDAPSTPYDEVIIGKSYYITGASYDPKPADSITDTKLPGYDLTIRYDDDDLDRAGLPYDLEPTELQLYYQNWISLKSVLNLVEEQAGARLSPESPDTLLLLQQRIKRKGVDPARLNELLAVWSIPPEALDLLLKWAGAEDMLEVLGVNWDLSRVLEQLVMLSIKVVGATLTDQDIWFSRWLPVVPSPTNGQQESNQAVISAPIIHAEVVPKPKEGSRTITVKGLTQPGTYALMYHKESEGHDEYSTGH